MSAKSQVLVVDDEADIRELLGMTLARMGLEAHCAASTSEARRPAWAASTDATRSTPNISSPRRASVSPSV